MLKDRGFEVECLARTKALYSNSIITTFRLRYPRFIHSELMTHRMFSRNASSSRAIPISTLAAEVTIDPAMPVFWGANRSGMQADQECNNPVRMEYDKEEDEYYSREEYWKSLAIFAADSALQYSKAGYHKQIVNRILEPFQFINVLVTATDWENFFTLRRSDLAQPEIHLLADMMLEEMECTRIKVSNWHLPFNVSGETLEESLIINTSKAAKISYNRDIMECSFENHKKIHDMLWEHKHMSPFEHCARCFSEDEVFSIEQLFIKYLPEWVDPFYCRNFKGFKSYRFLLETGEIKL